MWIWFYIKVNTCLTNQGLYGLSVVLCYSITVNSVMLASEHRTRMLGIKMHEKMKKKKHISD